MNFGREVVKGFKESDEAAELIAKHEGRSSADPSVGNESWCFPIWAGVRLVKGFLNPCFVPKSLYQGRMNLEDGGSLFALSPALQKRMITSLRAVWLCSVFSASLPKHLGGSCWCLCSLDG